MKRFQIVRKIHKNSEKIKALRKEQIELNRQQLLLSDRNQWYKEAEETWGRGKNKATELRGRVYWKEGFTDEDTGRIIYIERSEVVKVNGEWVGEY